jgi:ABC-type glycerol-3-phosphate transport system permease component
VTEARRPAGSLARRLATQAFLFVFFGAVALIFVFPFYWMAVSSLRTNGQIFSAQFNLIPSSITWKNYHDLFTTTLFFRWVLNSVIVAAGTTLLGIFFSTFAGFAFAKYKFVGAGVLFMSIFVMISIPRFVTIIPIFKVLSDMSLTNTYAALILPFAVNPFAVFLMRQYIRSVPDDLLDSARIDGLNELGLVLRIVAPTIRPAIGAAGIFILMTSWNDFLFPLILMGDSNMTLFPVGLSSLKTLYVIEWGMIMAGSLLSTLPLLLAFLLLQRHFVAGLTEGSVKG